jgi:hypothetical protein
MKTMNTTSAYPKLTLVAAATASLLLLAACGGGSGGGTPTTLAPPAQLGIATSSGTVTGFGSVLVDGVRIDDRNVIAGVEQENGDVMKAELKLGQHVDVEYDDNKLAKQIRITSEVKGVVQSVDVTKNTLTILGQTVVINTSAANGPVTVFDAPYTTLVDVKSGDSIEISGVFKTDIAGKVTVQATRIEKADPAAFQRVRGHVTDLSTTALTFKVGDLLVSYANATVKPSTAALANGADVVVSINATQTVTAGTAVSAAVVKVKNHREENQDKDAKLGGTISKIDPAAKTFVIDGVKVDASKAVFEQSSRTFADLLDGLYIRVQGTYQADGSFKATSIAIRKLEHDDNREVELHGSILNFVSNADFTIRGVKVDASSATTKIKDCPAGTVLANNLQVEVEGTLSATGKVIATEVKCENNQQGESIIERMGVATKVDTVARSFTLGDTQTVVYTTNTLFVGVEAATLYGKKIEIEGTLSGTVLTATKIKLADR